MTKIIRQCHRICILGASGTGKTHLAYALASLLDIPVVDLDDIIFIRKYDIVRPKDKRRELLRRRLKSKKWIIAGMLSSWNSAMLPLADRIIILRERFVVEAVRIVRRYFQRKVFARERRESLRGLIAFLIKDYRTYHGSQAPKGRALRNIQRKYRRKVIFLDSKREVGEFIATLSQ